MSEPGTDEQEPDFHLRFVNRSIAAEYKCIRNAVYVDMCPPMSAMLDFPPFSPFPLDP